MPQQPPASVVALDAVIDLATKQLELLADAAKRPDVDANGLARTSFEMTLKGIKASVAGLAQDASLPAEVRARIKRFVDAVDGYELHSVRLGQHLIAISDGWQCPSCGSDVARGAALSGVALGKSLVKLELVCAECQARSQPTPQGRKLFEAKFGHLVAPGWNAEASGFLWDRR